MFHVPAAFLLFYSRTFGLFDVVGLHSFIYQPEIGCGNWTAGWTSYFSDISTIRAVPILRFYTPNMKVNQSFWMMADVGSITGKQKG